MYRLSSPRIFIHLTAVLLLPIAATEAQQSSVVSPPGFGDVDGDMLFLPVNSPFPTPGPMGTPDGWRAQELHPPAAFEILGDGPFTLTGLAWRPDTSVNAPISTAWDLTLNLSTTMKQPDSLSSMYAENYGVAGFTQVFNATLPFETDGMPRGEGLPHNFDFVVEFDAPYHYDPTQGNLLIEWITPSDLADTWVWVDADSRTSGFVFDPSATAEVARFGGPGLFVTQFNVVPEPASSSTLFLGMGIFCYFWQSNRHRRRPIQTSNYGRLVASIALFVSANLIAHGAVIVVPPGLEHTEGNDLVLVQYGAPENGFRAQYPYVASDFSGLPDGHDTILAMAWRADHSVIALNTQSMNFELRLSTTSARPGNISSTFGQNTGADEVLVYSGPITLETDGSGPAIGPRPFDYLIEFQKPFNYDPKGGNLLVDFSILPPAEGTLFLDSEATALVQSVGETDASSSVATLTSNEVIPVQFTFVPLGDCDRNDLLDANDLGCVSNISERDAVLSALKTLPGDLDGNGDVSFADFLVLSGNFGKDLPNYADGNIDLKEGVAFADFLLLSANFDKTLGNVAASPVPEPTSVCLAMFGVLGLMAFRRCR